jgi:hypothetical protein
MRKIHPPQWIHLVLMSASLAFGQTLYAQGTTAVPYVLLLATDPTALEGTSSGAFTLIRYGPNTNDLKVLLSISGTASNGVDYATINDSVTVPTGSQAVDILVSPIIDTARRGNKTVVLSVVTNSEYRVGGERRATVTIVDDVFNIPPPTVAITSPTNGSSLNDPKSITIQADAADTGIAVTSVSFYANDTFLGKSVAAPYSLVWTNPHAGEYTLFARAVNQVGQSTLSAPVQITVIDVLPVIAITSPTNGENFLAHDNITIKADASDTDDSIQSVRFYANSHFLGVVTNTPYSLVWSNVPDGRVVLVATATDESGDRAYSKPVTINISRLPGPNVVKGPSPGVSRLPAQRN